MEWDTPVGEAAHCGGDALVRTAALVPSGGYREDLIAGEEPELCVRLRTAGWKVWRIDHEMTRHDIALHSFAQWWKRSVRSGHAYAEGAALARRPARAALGARKPQHLDLGSSRSARRINIRLANARRVDPLGCHCLPGVIREDTPQPRREPHGTCRIGSPFRRVVRRDEMATGSRSGNVLVQPLARITSPDHRIQLKLHNQARSKQPLDFSGNTLTPVWGA